MCPSGQICKKCGEEKTARAITVNKRKMIVVGQTIIKQAESLQCEGKLHAMAVLTPVCICYPFIELTCFHCTLRAMQTNGNGSAPTVSEIDE